MLRRRGLQPGAAAVRGAGGRGYLIFYRRSSGDGGYLCRACTAIVDGKSHGLVLREGVMLIALHTIFDAKPSPVRAVT